MFENRISSGNRRATSGLLRVVSAFCLLAIASCNSEKINQVEAKAAAAEKNSAALAEKVAAVNAELATERARMNALSAQVKAAEQALAAVKVEKIQNVTAKSTSNEPEATTTKAATAVKPSDADAIRVHSLAAADQKIAKEYAEMTPALKACDKDNKLGLVLCVMSKQGKYSAWLPVLVTWNKEAISTASEARALLGCLQDQPAVKKDKDGTDKNAAELALLSGYTGSCLPKPAE